MAEGNKKSGGLSRRQFISGVGAVVITSAIAGLAACRPVQKEEVIVKEPVEEEEVVVREPVEEKEATPPSSSPEGGVLLPEPRLDSDVSIEEALLKRRSVRDYTGEALTLQEVSQLLWAAQGITLWWRGFRTAPSASATYPLETYIVVGDVEDLSEGVYHYEPVDHKIVKVLNGDHRVLLTRASMGQYFIEGGAVYIVFNAIYERTAPRLSDEGIGHVHKEVGHAAQNVYLQAVALGLGTVVIGGFSSERAREYLKFPENEHTLYFMPVGRV